MLNEDQIARLKAEATRRGLDENALIEAGNRVTSAASADPKAAPASTAADAPKIFQYHLPFIRVRELRQFIGLTDAIANDDMLCGEFLERFGGALNPASGGGAASTPADAGQP